MIRLEIFSTDGTLAVSNEWAAEDARKMSAYRMRWLRGGRHWAIVTSPVTGMKGYGPTAGPAIWAVRCPDGTRFVNSDGETVFPLLRARLCAQHTGGEVVPASVFTA
jgi:hypothetical protein